MNRKLNFPARGGLHDRNMYAFIDISRLKLKMLTTCTAQSAIPRIYNTGTRPVAILRIEDVLHLAIWRKYAHLQRPS